MHGIQKRIVYIIRSDREPSRQALKHAYSLSFRLKVVIGRHYDPLRPPDAARNLAEAVFDR